nr:DUF6499 domain-containing protein [Devosia sp. LC5]
MFFDDLPIEGLAWECLRRNAPYQAHYRALIDANTTEEPLSPLDERKWGLRFPGETGADLAGPTRALVASHQSNCGHAHADAAGTSRVHRFATRRPLPRSPIS